MKPENLHDSELIHYAGLSDDPEKRRLAEIAARAEPWERMLDDHWVGDTPEAVAELIAEHGDFRTALQSVDALDDVHNRPDYDYLQYLARLSQAADAGRVQLVEDCTYCSGDRRVPHPNDGYPVRCPDCKGRGVTFTPADSDSI